MKKTIEIDLELTPQEVAEIFWNMDNSEQAEIFNCLSNVQGFGWQMNQVSLSASLNGGVKAMKVIGLAVEDGEAIDGYINKLETALKNLLNVYPASSNSEQTRAKIEAYEILGVIK